ncbi:TIGR00341 family protein [Natrialbaceae archaeon AArc-T1-2]|uniref:TIGR00341 family protein n=1 Tax=Natrialbaceae archaeon AArc-T1-2 TaxID=3053904 RepID=UPI00255A8A36|nr:TIGR00341 family protein [Natrialbaceae archaeon AArc-T1-2]WIV67399.1 TIGR00341 family protein [Natrialbaceae archaeon AArc-T1-2]
MRLVEVLIPKRKREAVEEVLEDEGIDYTLVEEGSHDEPSVVVTFPLPTPAVESILDDLRETGIDEDSYTVIVEAETVVSDRYDDLEQRYAQNTARISREEMQARAKDLTPRFSTYLVMTIMSVIVATAGLLLDSPAVVVGSMVIAPLIGPALGASVGTVINDQALFWRGIKLQAIGLGIGVVTAAVFAIAVRQVGLVSPMIDLFAISEIEGRVRPDLLSLVIAIGAGVAGAWTLTAGTSAALVGVMIAAALVPPLGVVGIGIAWGRPEVAIAAGVLVLVNILAINVTSLAVLWQKGYRPENWFGADEARVATRRRAIALVVAIVALSTFLGVVSYDTYRTGAYEEDVTDDVTAVLESPEYAELTLIDVTVEYTDPVPLRQPERVVVTIGHPVGTDPPPVAEEIQPRDSVYAESAIHLPTGPLIDSHRADVVVRYTEQEQ